ncbi:MAG: hypothetical protein JO325_04440 [Solirubrobacterales bacterium]|nr:hypothetical protein [Solirubrobacterales bacterium]
MALLVALYAAHDGLGLGGGQVNGLFDEWINDGLLWCAVALTVWAALRTNRSRAAWLLVAVALASWAIGSTIFSVRFGDPADPPATSLSDIFWLAWYPLIVAALVLLVRERVPGFELGRWIDGVTVMLLVATPWVALFLQPVAEHSSASGLAVAVNFAYPLGDAILVGAVLGVFALMAWRASRMWWALGIALAAMGIADAIYSVDALGHTHDRGIYNAAWAGAAILVAYAAWRPFPGRLSKREVTGWSAIALALLAQALAVSIQIFAIFDELPQIERILTVAVLIIASIQIVVSRPRPSSNPPAPRDARASAPPVPSVDRWKASDATIAPPKQATSAASRPVPTKGSRAP